MRGRLFFVIASVVLGAFAACTSENLPKAGSSPGTAQPGSATGTGSTAGGDSGGGGGGGDGGSCNNLMLTGKVVDAEKLQGDPPAAVGGTVVDGDYDITQINVYVGVTGVAGPAGFSEQGSMNITSGVIQRSTVAKDSTTNQTTTTDDTGNLSTPDGGGATLIDTLTCPGAGLAQYDYTATPTTLRLLNPITKTERVYTKR